MNTSTALYPNAHEHVGLRTVIIRQNFTLHERSWVAVTGLWFCRKTDIKWIFGFRTELFRETARHITRAKSRICPRRAVAGLLTLWKCTAVPSYETSWFITSWQKFITHIASILSWHHFISDASCVLASRSCLWFGWVRARPQAELRGPSSAGLASWRLASRRNLA